MNDTTGSSQLLEYSRRQLEGPANGEDEILESGDPPHNRYVSGVLYPQSIGVHESVAGLPGNGDDDILNEDDLEGAALGDQLADDPVRLAGQKEPSACGLTFFASGTREIAIKVRAARYEKDTNNRWVRRSLSEDQYSSDHKMTAPAESGIQENRKSLFEGQAQIYTKWRPMSDGYLITVTLLNPKTRPEGTSPDPEDCLYQTAMVIKTVTGSIKTYPDYSQVLMDEDEEELRLLGRNYDSFAIGHGCAADWDAATEPGVASSVRTEYIPSYTIPEISTRTGAQNDRILDLKWLANTANSGADLYAEAQTFIDRYETWSDELATSTTVPNSLRAARGRILERISLTIDAMRQGARILRDDENARIAFQYANYAMLIQMRHSRDDLGGTRKAVSEAPSLPSMASYTSSASQESNWYPFQLAFQLLTLPSIVDHDSSDRDIVDLLWFPTGGGKTEAYLVLSAFEIFHRRLKFGDKGGGTSVITRYTLRLLTLQQFQRSATLICACEFVRSMSDGILGSVPITIGLWVGAGAVANTYAKAVKDYADLLKQREPVNPFQLERCPWCGTEIVPQRKVSEEIYGVECTNSTFKFYCPNKQCFFGEELPIGVIDQALYDNPPSFLIATVDKFARLAWEERAGRFFGYGEHIPPSLIIQDELHLITGPLGSTVGVYESGINALIELYGEGLRPKILASTATTRGGISQIKGLYGKKTRMFPPSGLDPEDSFYSRADRDKPYTTYMGIMARSQRRASTGMIHVASVLLQSVRDVPMLSPAERDSFSTLVLYHNSLRELGQTSKFSRDDIPERIKIIASTEDNAREIKDDKILELTSTLSADSLPKSLERLTYSPDNVNSVDILLCTNMFSVGVDVPRLALMMMNGQPKTASEYIQATGRVGRGNVKGLVAAYYSDAKPRDRSHYETFIQFHSYMNMYVEPHTVTPFSLPSRKRALHAALVIVMRHWGGLSANDDASKFDKDEPKVARAVNAILQHIRVADSDMLKDTKQDLWRLVEDWDSRAKEASDNKYTLHYEGSGRGGRSLLDNFGNASSASWGTLHSMRNVDSSCLLGPS